MNKNHYCIIMAGGIGSRFWPLSRNERPKQFLDILGVGKTFIQQTYDRFAKLVPRENILVVTGKTYHGLVKEQLPELTDDQILLEPLRRNTAPCVAYATYKLLCKNPDATVIVAPSDHLILNEPEFLSVAKSCLEFAEKNQDLVTIGIKPTRPETGYGYIQIEPKETIKNTSSGYKVKTFTEKPNRELAQVFVDSGEFFWNSGIFVWSLKAIKNELETQLDEVASLFASGKDKYYTKDEKEFILTAYQECRNVSIDYGVMEKSQRVYVFCADFGWSDLGTWGSLYLHSERDENGNAIEADNVYISEVNNSLIKATTDKLIVAKGLENFLIVDTKDVLLVCPHNNDDEVKNFVNEVLIKKPDFS